MVLEKMFLSQFYGVGEVGYLFILRKTIFQFCEFGLLMLVDTSIRTIILSMSFLYCALVFCCH